jgi:rhodanese-related sulfurtransferase
VRSAAARSEGGIVGAHAYTGHVLSPALNAAARDRLVAVYCACPGEASAVMAARELMQHGFMNVVALEGGIDAWRAAGNALEPVRSD